MINNEYEVITHSNSNFHLFLVNLLYRTPHMHKDFELNLLLEGSLSILTANGVYLLSKGDLFIANPFTSHELRGSKPALVLSLQVSPLFFSSYYPNLENMEFDTPVIKSASSSAFYLTLRNVLLSLAYSFFKKEPYYELTCATYLNQLFLHLLQEQPHHLIPEKNKLSYQSRAKRMRKITRYIDTHYTEKLLLSDIAEQEELDLYYLSHFFKDCFGMTFQEYMTKIRCEHARQLLLLTDYSLLDISISCGFSDAKYFNKGFQLQYGCTPKEYRKSFQNAKLEQQQRSMLTTQEFLSEKTSLMTLEGYL